MGKKKEERKKAKKEEKKEEKKAKKAAKENKKDETSKKGRSGKQQCFLSHCSADGHLVDALDDCLTTYFTNCETFNTNREENSSYAGEERSQMLKSRLLESEIMVALMTDSYLRSPICISELSAFWYAEKVVIPIIFCQEGVQLLSGLFGRDVIYINAMGLAEPKKIADNQDNQLAIARMNLHTREEAEAIATELGRKMVKTMTGYGFLTENSAAAEQGFKQFFMTQGASISNRPYIGSDRIYHNIIDYCNEYGVNYINIKPDSVSLVRDHLQELKELYILSTTGRSLVHALSSDMIPVMLKNGVNITVLLPNRYSDFITDVAEIESPKGKEANEKRLSDEFAGVMNTLCRCLEAVEDFPEEKLGHIYIGCSFTMLRQTITIVKKDQYAWGQLSMTMPPKKTAEGTPCLHFEGDINTVSMAKLTYEHVQSIIRMAERRGALIDLNEAKKQPDSFMLEKKTAKELWQKYRDKAEKNTLAKDGDYELIEVAAQHPLEDGNKPGKEFSLRLDRAVELYRSFADSGRQCRIFVPGSRHMFEGVPDDISLSEAGRNYLLEKGIPGEDILGIEQMKRYKGKEGVYNSADECYVASKIYRTGNYHRLHCVCSSAQMLRKKLFYTAFGVAAQFHTVDADQMFHNDIHEIFETIPEVLYRDHTWQDSESKEYKRTRAERVVKE